MKNQLLLISLLSILFFSSCKNEEASPGTSGVVEKTPFGELDFDSIYPCMSDIVKTAMDSSSFHKASDVSIYEGLKPSLKVDYYEIVHLTVNKTGSETKKSEEIFYSFGAKTVAGTTDSPSSGFDNFSGVFSPISSYNFIRFQYKNVLYVISEDSDIVKFIGNVDSEADAILMSKIFHKGVYGGFSIFGIKANTNGYEILTHSSCLANTEGHRLYVETCGHFNTWDEFEASSIRCVE